MESAILGVVVLILTVMLYLDRSRRNDIRDLRQEMTTQIVALREEMNADFARTHARTDALRQEMTTQIVALREEMTTQIVTFREEMNADFARTHARIDQLTTAVINLAESLGQVKGRTEVLVAAE